MSFYGTIAVQRCFTEPGNKLLGMIFEALRRSFPCKWSYPSLVPDTQALEYVKATFEEKRPIYEFSMAWDLAAYDSKAIAAAVGLKGYDTLAVQFRRDLQQQRRWQRQVRLYLCPPACVFVRVFSEGTGEGKYEGCRLERDVPECFNPKLGELGWWCEGFDKQQTHRTYKIYLTEQTHSGEVNVVQFTGSPVLKTFK